MSPEMDITMRTSGPRLSDQVESMGRPQAMKEIVGPHLDKFLRPLYETEISPAEVSTLQSSDSVIIGVKEFHDGAAKVVRERFFRDFRGMSGFLEIEDLNQTREDLFYYPDAKDIFREAIASSLIIPLTVASHIYGLEKSEPDPEDIFADEICDVKALQEIMERENFDEILLHLTKGPNGFLGALSNDLQISDKYPFFSFVQDEERTTNLSVQDAYELEKGKVVGLSGKYHVAADIERRHVRKRNEPAVLSIQHPNSDSSGCPVRHSFPDPETGEPQEPLVITAKKFLIAALDALTGPSDASQKHPS